MPDATQEAGPSDAKQSLWRQPRSVFLVAGTELWERFSYYGLVALLVLFLTAPVAGGGAGLSDGEALRIYGVFAGLAFAMPVVGGWITDRWLGERRAVTLGGCGILLGNLALFAAGGGVAGARAGGPPAPLLWTGLALIILGTGLLKPAISTLVGRVYDDRPELSRRAGYTLFMMGIWAGSVGGTLFAGVAGEVIGWRWGFLVSSIGMAFGLGCYALLARRLLGSIGLRTIERETAVAAPAEAGQRRPVLLIGVMALFTAVYAVAFYQKAGALNLFVREATSRNLGGVVVPVSVFLTVSTAGFILLAPVIEAGFALLERRGVRADVFTKQIGALAMLAVGYAFFTMAAWQSAGAADGLHAAGWIIAGYLCFAVGDVLIWPPQITTISAIAPKHLTGMLIGGWFVTVGIGNYAAGYIGALAAGAGRADFFIWMQGGLIVAAAVLAVLRFALARTFFQSLDDRGAS